MNRKKRNNNKAFTLIELLVVAAMMAVISLAIYSTLSSGIRLWQKANNFKTTEDINIFFERFALDVVNSFEFTGINFQGKADRLDMPTLVKSPQFLKNGVGRVSYIYDRLGKGLRRVQSNYSQLYQNKEITSAQVLADIKTCKFSYYLFDQQKKEYYWAEETRFSELPLAVRVELEMDDAGEGYSFIKTVNIPVSEKFHNDQR